MVIDLLNLVALIGAFVVVPILLFAVARIEAWMDGSGDTRTPHMPPPSIRGPAMARRNGDGPQVDPPKPDNRRISGPA